MTLHLVRGVIQGFRWSMTLLMFQVLNIGCRIAHYLACRWLSLRFVRLIALLLAIFLVRGLTPFICLSMILLTFHLPEIASCIAQSSGCLQLT